ncbi:protease inhibitor I42 family protein [uncultured Methanomethylovorans sp.]|uniref:protease inhibitor I42 family protein n=1 Tax=uncultured Methanomethylovorans sp. TaxID=183759 RepID=UPI002AA7D2EE|nr:protease inhibitor I42 family protein [uncultured Methanomethylovorans sp.]
MASSGCTTSPAQDVLKGTVSFEEQNVSFSNATAYVTIEDVSVADSPSTVVEEQIISGLSINETKTTFQYAVPTSKLEEGTNYSLSVHIDVDGDGNVSQADYITTQHYPLILDSKALDVVVQKVSGDSTAAKVFTEEQNGTSPDMKIGELVIIRLEENPTTGYSWNMSFTDGLKVVQDEYISSAQAGVVGAGGVHEWSVQANSAGHYNVSGIYKRPWENVTGEEDTYNLTLNVNP